MINLTKDELEYLIKKVEYKKKKKMLSGKEDSELYNLLHGSGEMSEENFNKILKSLEYSFRKRLAGSKPALKNDLFLSIQSKMPKESMPVKMSKVNFKPSISQTKEEIIEYLKGKGIKDIDENKSKKQLLKLLENKVFKFSDY